MFIRPCYREKDGKRHAYWALVESYRTQRGPRQRVVAYLGELDEAGRLGVQQAAEGRKGNQRSFFEEREPQWIEIDANRVRAENSRQFGGPWLALELIRQIGLDKFLQEVLPQGREEIPRWATSLILIIARLCEPSSELYIAEHFYRQSALFELLGVPQEKIDDNRLYRTLDALLPHKERLEMFLKNRLGELFKLEYDLLLYDVTSTYFEGLAQGAPLAQRGYSRDHRPDCKQICIGLVVSRCGMPLGYEVFAGNRTDVTTVQEIIQTMESRYGKADRVWVFDRGMVSEANIEFLQAGGRKYIIGSTKSMLKRFEQQLLEEDRTHVRDGVEVKICSCPKGTEEVYILCRSQKRREKERAIVQRFEKRIEEGLERIQQSIQRRKEDPFIIAKRVGRLLGENSRAARLFDVDVGRAADGKAQLSWKKVEPLRSWTDLSQGCYLLRSNVQDWSHEQLWNAYIQLTDAEAAFRIHKSDLSIRPIWHQKQERILAHILVCFLSFVLWKTLAQLGKRAGIGNEPRRVLDEISELRLIDVILPTKAGIEIKKLCITKPSAHQQILLQHLHLQPPIHLKPLRL